MRNVSIKVKVLGALIIPVIAILIFSTSLLYEKIKIYKEINKFGKATELSVKIGNLVHETQKERGASAGYLGSKGAKFSDTLRAQRMATDQKLNELKNFVSDFDFSQYPSYFGSLFHSAMSQLNKLNSIRAQVDSLSISVQDEVAYYTDINTKLLNVVGKIGFLVTDSELAKAINAYANFLLSKERAGIERAVLSNTFGADKFKKGMYEKFIKLITEQSSYLNSFMLTAPKEFIQYYKDTVKGDAIDKVNEMRNIAFKDHEKGGFNVDASYWFATITKKINLLKKVENHFANEILKLMNEKKSSAIYSATLYSTLFVISVISIIMLFIAIKFSVLGNLKKLSDAISDLAKGEGDLTKRLHINQKDEIAELFDLINSFVKNIDNNLSNTLDHISNNADAIIPLINIVSDVSLSATTSNDVASQVSAAAAEMSATISEIAESTIQSAARVEETLNMAHEGKASIDEANSASQEVSQIMNQLTNEINELKEEAEKIGSVIAVINDIADQTNLLALNAAIEAARAGEAGRGFAVVADEVRKLAEKTQSSTSEISGVISKIQDDISNAVDSTVSADQSIQKQEELFGNASANFNEIVNSVDEVNNLITSISAAVEEQSATTEEISRSIEVVANDAEMLTNKASTLVNITDVMVDSVIKIDHEFAKFKVSNKAVPLIRGKIAHAVFLNNIQQCVESGKCEINISDHTNCEFGKFYYSKGRELFGNYPEFSEIESVHAQVHEMGRKIIDTVRNADVESCKNLYEEFQATVSEFLDKVNALADRLRVADK